MISILDQCLALEFQIPRNPQEYLALQIARKLGDLKNIREYAILLEHFPERLIVGAFQRAVQIGQLGKDAFLAAFREVIALTHDES